MRLDGKDFTGVFLSYYTVKISVRFSKVLRTSSMVFQILRETFSVVSGYLLCFFVFNFSPVSFKVYGQYHLKD